MKLFLFFVLLVSVSCQGSSLLCSFVHKLFQPSKCMSSQELIDSYFKARNGHIKEIPEVHAEWEMVVVAQHFYLCREMVPRLMKDHRLTAIEALKKYFIDEVDNSENREIMEGLFDLVLIDLSRVVMCKSLSPAYMPLLLSMVRDMHALKQCIDKHHKVVGECTDCKIWCQGLLDASNLNGTFESYDTLNTPARSPSRITDKLKYLLTREKEKKVYSLPLIAAVDAHQWEATVLFLQNGASPTAEDFEEKTALSLAQEKKLKKYVRLFEFMGRYSNQMVKIPEREGGHPALCRLIRCCPALVSRWVKDEQGYSVLYRAILSEDLDLIEAVLMAEPYLIMDLTASGVNYFEFCIDGAKWQALQRILSVAYKINEGLTRNAPSFNQEASQIAPNL